LAQAPGIRMGSARASFVALPPICKEISFQTDYLSPCEWHSQPMLMGLGC